MDSDSDTGSEPANPPHRKKEGGHSGNATKDTRLGREIFDGSTKIPLMEQEHVKPKTQKQRKYK